MCSLARENWINDTRASTCKWWISGGAPVAPGLYYLANPSVHLANSFFPYFFSICTTFLWHQCLFDLGFEQKLNKWHMKYKWWISGIASVAGYACALQAFCTFGWLFFSYFFSILLVILFYDINVCLTWGWSKNWINDPCVSTCKWWISGSNPVVLATVNPFLNYRKTWNGLQKYQFTNVKKVCHLIWILFDILFGKL